MFYLLFTTPAKTKLKIKRGRRRSANKEEKIITFALFVIWVFLIAFAVISKENPVWLRNIADPGRVIEAKSNKDVGDVCMREGHYVKAIGYYVTALKIKSDYDDALVNLGIAYSKIGEFDKAIKILKSILKEDVEYFNLGMIFEKLEKTEDAIQYYSKAAELAPNPFRSYCKLGQLHLQSGNSNLSISAFKNALANRSNLSNNYLTMLKFSLKTFKDNPEVLKKVKLSLKEGIDIEKLRIYDDDIYEEDEEIKHTISEIYNFLGLAYLQKENIDEAIRHFQLSLKIWSENVKAKRNLIKLTPPTHF